MVKLYRFILSFLLCFSLTSLIQVEAQFQATRVERSNQKILYQGTIYYIHTVKPGHTLYSICAAYNVKEEDIRDANRELDLSTLSVGQVLRIPAESPAETTEQKQDDNFIYHTVKAKETTFFLHKKYGVSLEDIYKYNPGTEQGLQIGQVVRIPTGKPVIQDSKGILPDQDEDIIKYVVRTGDTLYSIAKFYNIPMADIINANESLRWGLKAGQTIYIPTDSSSYRYLAGRASDSILTISEVAQLSKFQCDSIVRLRRMAPPLKLAVMMPFYASEEFKPDTSSVNDSLSGSTNRYNGIKGRGAAELYEGLLLAVDSLKKNGANIRMFVYDTEADTVQTKSILKELDIVQPDLIIGPLSTSNVKLVSEYSKINNIPFVPPLIQSDTLIKHNPYLFQVMPATQYEIEKSAKYLSQFTDRNLILVYKNNLVNREQANHFRQSLMNEFSQKNSTDTLFISEVFIDDSLQINIESALLQNKRNFVIIASTYEPEVRNVLTNLHSQLRFFDIEIYGMPVWQKYKNVQIEHYHDLQLTLYSPFFINYSDENVKRFIRTCRIKLGYEPYKTSSRGTGINYTFLGYDLGMYFIQLVDMYGENTCDCATNYSEKLLLTNYVFIRNPQFACFENSTLNFIKYNKDFSIVLIEQSE